MVSAPLSLVQVILIATAAGGVAHGVAGPASSPSSLPLPAAEALALPAGGRLGYAVLPEAAEVGLASPAAFGESMRARGCGRHGTLRRAQAVRGTAPSTRHTRACRLLPSRPQRRRS